MGSCCASQKRAARRLSPKLLVHKCLTGLFLRGITGKCLGDVDTGLGPSPLIDVGPPQERKDKCFPTAHSRYLPSEGLLRGELAPLLLALI